ncbi:MAG: hypothetical protein MK193_08200 [Lentisphaeria bacterium]|nr:hypothetical protein [Lentisphaeria bacterium]
MILPLEPKIHIDPKNYEFDKRIQLPLSTKKMEEMSHKIRAINKRRLKNGQVSKQIFPQLFE